jgi:hypothetical protein
VVTSDDKGGGGVTYHSILEENEQHKAVSGELDQVHERQRRVTARTVELARKQQEVEEAYRAAYRVAVETGGPFPERPVPPPAEPNLAMELGATEGQLQERLMAVRRQIAPQVAAAATRRERELLGLALSTKVADLGPIRDELRELTEAVHACVADGCRTDTRIGEVVMAALSGGSVLHLGRRPAGVIPGRRVEPEPEPAPEFSMRLVREGPGVVRTERVDREGKPVERARTLRGA